jgi:hypothetical protein
MLYKASAKRWEEGLEHDDSFTSNIAKGAFKVKE